VSRRRAFLCGLTALAALPATSRAQGRPTIRQVTDMAGRSVRLPARIERVVTLGSLPVLNSFVFALGEGRTIVNGLADFDRPHWKYQTVFAPQLAGQPPMQLPNREPIAEAILAASPDVVLTLHREAVDRLAALGIPVVYLAWREPEDVKACIRLMGEVFEKPQVALAYQQWFDATLARVRQGLATLAPSQRPRVLYMQPDTLTQPRLIAEWWIPAAGGISLSADGRRAESRGFSLEQLLTWDPEVLILTTPQALRMVRTSGAFAGLRAVRENRLHVVPVGAHTWSNRTAEQPLTVLWAARTFHPRLFAGWDLAAEASRFYAEFFGTRLTDVQIAEVLSGDL